MKRDMVEGRGAASRLENGFVNTGRRPEVTWGPNGIEVSGCGQTAVRGGDQ